MSGAQFVTIIGTRLTPMLFVANWDFQDLVNFHYCNKLLIPCIVIIYYSILGAIAYCCARDGQGSGPIHMSNVGCRGHELSLSGCAHATNHNCHHREDASVQCRTSITRKHVIQNIQ